MCGTITVIFIRIVETIASAKEQGTKNEGNSENGQDNLNAHKFKPNVMPIVMGANYLLLDDRSLVSNVC